MLCLATCCRLHVAFSASDNYVPDTDVNDDGDDCYQSSHSLAVIIIARSFGVARTDVTVIWW